MSVESVEQLNTLDHWRRTQANLNIERDKQIKDLTAALKAKNTDINALVSTFQRKSDKLEMYQGMYKSLEEKYRASDVHITKITKEIQTYIEELEQLRATKVELTHMVETLQSENSELRDKLAFVSTQVSNLISGL